MPGIPGIGHGIGPIGGSWGHGIVGMGPIDGCIGPVYGSGLIGGTFMEFSFKSSLYIFFISPFIIEISHFNTVYVPPISIAIDYLKVILNNFKAFDAVILHTSS